MSGQGRGDDGFADAPAPALQRMIGRRPVSSAVILTATYAAIGIHTGLSAWHFPISAYSDEAGHAFRFEAGHPFRNEAGHRSDLKPAT